MLSLFVNTYIKMFFLLAPFFTMSLFLKMAEEMDASSRRRAAMRASATVLIAVTVFFFFGKPLFGLLGITLAAFQIGTGTTLFLTSVMLVLGISKPPQHTEGEDFAVVPLGLPIIVGPGTIGTLMVWGTQITNPHERLVMFAGILAAAVTMSLFLLMADQLRNIFGQKVIAVMTKLTALVLTALAAQIVFTGIKNF
ncbi:MAG TPA: MarC family protein [Anaerohalosphaeraceae bacterium]|mgnify:CR=1 FL=1|nr:MarC family protein [Phycisphaerae bacterium]HOK94509.1 MarC family protein [Anaerohalosphaeraceae bacterium]HOL31452.1 MarC family protein [Anaerohalosphaeraceae bacterium]HOM75322.1 MarC family protein [Anaerohalosphaeraceae bacterium]HPC63310.1 MarC family protein [Anaerohalosphaeraceae bacterium]